MDWSQLDDLFIKWFVPFACGTCIACVGWLYKLVRKIAMRQRASNAGLTALLAASQMDIYYRCCARGYATQQDRHNASQAYKAYHGLGANGEMTDVYGKILALPIREDG